MGENPAKGARLGREAAVSYTDRVSDAPRAGQRGAGGAQEGGAKNRLRTALPCPSPAPAQPQPCPKFLPALGSWAAAPGQRPWCTKMASVLPVLLKSLLCQFALEAGAATGLALQRRVRGAGRAPSLTCLCLVHSQPQLLPLPGPEPQVLPSNPRPS